MQYNGVSIFGGKMRYIAVLLVLMCSHMGLAQEGNELNQTMKKMGHQYKLAVKSSSTEELQTALVKMKTLAESSKNFHFKADVAKQSQKGLDKVINTIDSALSDINQGQPDKARARIAKIDELRKHYHELHEPPSFWELLFGS